jgi:hypothetical protein
MAEFYDFDAAVGEIEPRLFSFKYEEGEYTVDLNVDAGKLLLFLEASDSVRALPQLLRLFLSDEQYAKLTESGAKWQKLELLIAKFTTALGQGQGDEDDSGN